MSEAPLYRKHSMSTSGWPVSPSEAELGHARPSWGHSKVNFDRFFWKRRRFSPDVDKNGATAPRTGLGYPHEGPFAATAPEWAVPTRVPRSQETATTPRTIIGPLGTGLLQGPRGGLFLMSEVPLHDAGGKIESRCRVVFCTHTPYLDHPQNTSSPRPLT